LYLFRAGRGKQNAKDRSNTVKHYCLYCMNNQVVEIAKCPSNDCPLYIFRRGHQERIENDRSSTRQSNFHQLIQEQRL
jgi:hypothetical protein